MWLTPHSADRRGRGFDFACSRSLSELSDLQHCTHNRRPLEPPVIRSVCLNMPSVCLNMSQCKDEKSRQVSLGHGMAQSIGCLIARSVGALVDCVHPDPTIARSFDPSLVQCAARSIARSLQPRHVIADLIGSHCIGFGSALTTASC